MEIVRNVLNKQQKQLAKYKPITVDKLLDCHIDVGRLLVKDPNDLQESRLQ